MTALYPAVDHIRANVPLPVGSTRDDTLAPPLKHGPTTLYAFPVRETRRVLGDGSLDDGQFRLRLEYCHAPAGEEARAARTRAVSVALDEAAEAVAGWVRGNRQSAHYDQLQIETVIYDTVRTLDFRGFALELSGYRMVS